MYMIFFSTSKTPLHLKMYMIFLYNSPKTPQVVKTVPVSGNLDLYNEGDIDMGRITNGSPMPILSGPLNVPASPIDIRLRSTAYSLKAFDFTIMFNTSYIHVSSCYTGLAWAGTFSCTINNAEGYVQVFFFIFFNFFSPYNNKIPRSLEQMSIVPSKDLHSM